MTKNNRSFKELVRQIEAYGLKEKLADLVYKEEAKRPFVIYQNNFQKVS